MCVYVYICDPIWIQWNSNNNLGCMCVIRFFSHFFLLLKYFIISLVFRQNNVVVSNWFISFILIKQTILMMRLATKRKKIFFSYVMIFFRDSVVFPIDLNFFFHSRKLIFFSPFGRLQNYWIYEWKKWLWIFKKRCKFFSHI